jgi:hypothetical protein
MPTARRLTDAGQTDATEPALADAACWRPDPGVLNVRADGCYLTLHLAPSRDDDAAAPGHWRCRTRVSFAPTRPVHPPTGAGGKCFGRTAWQARRRR